MSLKKKQIIDYSELGVTESFFNHLGSKMFYRKGEKEQQLSEEIDIVESITEKCRFCQNEMTHVFTSFSKRYVVDDDVSVYKRIFECQKCGWWILADSLRGMTFMFSEYGDDIVYPSIVKSFDISDSEIPILSLNAEVKKKPDILYKLAPSKLEELVGHVYGQFFDCEVIHCGGPNDGGVDVILINSDNPILIQVKRRSSVNKIEPVSLVREFLGAMAIQKSRHGIYVSTAKEFSKSSKEVAEKVLRERTVEHFELHNFDKLTSILKCNKNNIDCTWKEVAKYYKDNEEVIHDLYGLFK